MTPPESKLKRSPYLSQMTQHAGMKITAKLTHPDSGEGAQRSKNEGLTSDFFELKRCHVSLKPDQHSLRFKGQNKHHPVDSHALGTGEDVFVHLFIEAKQRPMNRLEVSHMENQSLISVNNLHQSGVVSHISLNVQSHQSQSTRSLQYYYNTGMKSTISLSLDGRSARAMTFRDVLDEGDGKEGDLNVQLRNDQWKSFMDGKTGNHPRHMCRNRRQHGERCFSANDLAVLRRAACHRRMKWVTSPVQPGQPSRGTILCLLSDSKHEDISNASSKQFSYVDFSKLDALGDVIKMQYTQRISAPLLGVEGIPCQQDWRMALRYFEFCENLGQLFVETPPTGYSKFKLRCNQLSLAMVQKTFPT